jgi:hypothetical protein
MNVEVLEIVPGWNERKCGPREIFPAAPPVCVAKSERDLIICILETGS